MTEESRWKIFISIHSNPFINHSLLYENLFSQNTYYFDVMPFVFLLFFGRISFCLSNGSFGHFHNSHLALCFFGVILDRITSKWILVFRWIIEKEIEHVQYIKCGEAYRQTDTQTMRRQQHKKTKKKRRKWDKRASCGVTEDRRDRM